MIKTGTFTANIGLIESYNKIHISKNIISYIAQTNQWEPEWTLAPDYTKVTAGNYI